MRNLRIALRVLRRTPFVSAVAIAANAAIFSLFEQTLLRPLPVAQPGRLVNLGNPGPEPGGQSCGQAGDCDVVFSYAMFRDLERSQKVFTGLAVHALFGSATILSVLVAFGAG